jgi:hypothetical protein
MGQSTDAILAYGFDLGSEDEPPEAIQRAMEETGVDDVDDWIERLAGVEPWEPNRPDSYWAEKREKLAAFPIDIIRHCSGDYPMYFLAIRGTEVRANRGSPQKVSTPADCGDWEVTLQKFCAEHGIEYQDPDWHIFSDWN